MGNVSRAAHLAGIDRRTHTNWVHEDTNYASAFLDAKEAAADSLEEVAWMKARALRGGSDTLAIFLLKGLRPQIYRERFEHSGPNGGPIETKAIDEAKSTLEKKLTKLLERTAAGKKSK